MRPIDADALKEAFYERGLGYQAIDELINEAPTIDAVPIEALKKWLWKVALNNSDNYLGDACEELVSRLDGLRRYVKDGEE